MVPVIDFSPSDEPALAQQVDEALTHTGFLAVRGVGLDEPLVRSAFAAAIAFFALDETEKQRWAYTDPSANFGYQPALSEALDPSQPADLKEAFTMRNLLTLVDDSAMWPSSEFRDVAVRCYQAFSDAAMRMLEVFAVALGQPADFFTARHSGENMTMRYLHYPSLGYEVGDAQMGAGAHTDYGAITLLLQDDAGGLQLQHDGRWLDVPPVAGTVNVNTGDLMAHWSNDRYPSTLHRVVPKIGARDRYSIAFFVDPDSDVLVRCLPGCVSEDRPPRYADVTAGEHIQRKILASQS